MTKKGYKQTEDHKRKIGKSGKESQNTPEVKNKKRKSMLEVWERPGFREKFKEIMKETQNTPEVKEKFSKAALKRWKNPEIIDKLSGSNHCKWIGGDVDYWAREMKKIYKECVLCGSDILLQMHHMDKDRKNNERSNRVILCLECHQFWHHN